MKEVLENKLKGTGVGYTDEETQWMVENIGHESGAIRDRLVYASLAKGLSEELFTLEQFDYLKKQTIENDLMLYKIEEGLPSSLTRTFAALLNASLVAASNNPKGLYYQRIDAKEYRYFFETAIQYLQKESDYTGYSVKHGWVHGIAHGADALAEVVCHEQFDKANTNKVLSTIMQVIQTLEQPFFDVEERRLAVVIYQGIIAEKFTQTEIADWIHQAHFPVVENRDYYRLAMFENLLAAIYFHLMDRIVLIPELEAALLSYLKKY